MIFDWSICPQKYTCFTVLTFCVSGNLVPFHQAQEVEAKKKAAGGSDSEGNNWGTTWTTNRTTVMFFLIYFSVMAVTIDIYRPYLTKFWVHLPIELGFYWGQAQSGHGESGACRACGACGAPRPVGSLGGIHSHGASPIAGWWLLGVS